MRRIFTTLCIPAMVLLLFASVAGAATLLTRPDSGGATPLGGLEGVDRVVIPWTHGEASTNTSILAFNLVNPDDCDDEGMNCQANPLELLFDLYRTAVIDPTVTDVTLGSITFADQVNLVQAQIFVPAGAGVDEEPPYTAQIFSGLNLVAGSYYLVAMVDSGRGEWFGGTEATGAAGFAFMENTYVSPALDDTYFAITDGPSIAVIGDLEPAGIPEPATMVLTGAGLALLAFAARRRRA